MMGFALLGILAGAILGVLLGIGYVEAAHVSYFEGHAGTLIGLVFMPLTALMGGIVAAIWGSKRLKRS